MKQIFKKLLAWWRKPRTKRLDPRDHLHLPFHPHCKCSLGVSWIGSELDVDTIKEFAKAHDVPVWTARQKTPTRIVSDRSEGMCDKDYIAQVHKEFKETDKVHETDTVELGYEGGTVAPRTFTDIRFPEPAIPVEYVEPITLSGKRIGGFFRIADGVRPILTGDIDGFGETVREAATELVGEDVKFSVRSEDPEPSDEIEVVDVEYKSCDVKVAEDGKAIDSVRLTGVLHRGALEEQVKCLKMAHVTLDECDWADEPAVSVEYRPEQHATGIGSLNEHIAKGLPLKPTLDCVSTVYIGQHSGPVIGKTSAPIAPMPREWTPIDPTFRPVKKESDK